MKKHNSMKNEYEEIREFILTMQEKTLRESDSLLAKKKDLEYRKRQKELLLEDKEKRRSPNISLFSPLNTEDMYESENSYQEEIAELEKQISEVEKQWQEANASLLSFDRLKEIYATFEKKLEKAVKNEFNETENYSIKLLETQELDRNRISRDLHDSTVQGLTTLIHKAEYCSKMIEIDPVCAKLELQAMIEINRDIINGIREIIYDLRPMALNNLGFIATIESYCLHLQRNDRIKVHLFVDGKEQELNSIVCVTLYRILQEACNNVMKHSEAKNLWIRIIYKKDEIDLEVEDDGKGFDAEENLPKDELHGFGLSTMKERANLLNGSFSIDSKSGVGTKIHVVVPMDNNFSNEK